MKIKDIYLRAGDKESARIHSLLMNRAETTEDIEAILTTSCIPYRQDPDSDYFNIRIDRQNGFVRIYQDNRGDINVQSWTRTEYVYSGIPTFEPSGRHSF